MADVDTAMSVPPFLKIAEVAPIFGKHPSTLWLWVQQDRFPIELRSIAGVNYVRTVDLEEYVGRPITRADLDLKAAS